MPAHDPHLAALGVHLSERRDAILAAWREAVLSDPTLKAAAALPRTQLNDHIPALLADFERSLIEGVMADSASVRRQQADDSAAHGLHRWQQGFDLQEVTRELARLNECVVVEVDAYAVSQPVMDPVAMARARRVWARQYGVAVSGSTSQYFELQQMESRSHIRDLEQALEALRELEQQRAQLWQQAAHDLRGNLGVVTNASHGLTATQASDAARTRFLELLNRNVKALHHLLNDVTSLARLQSGQEQAVINEVDVAALLRDFGESVRQQAEARGLALQLQGPEALVVRGDAVKIRRVAQNLVLNAIRYTRQGSVTIAWGNAPADDGERWLLRVTDTGPGFHAGPGSPLVGALGEATDQARQTAADARNGKVSHGAGSHIAGIDAGDPRPVVQVAGEGIGLSIVKRLCALLDATIELETAIDVGTTFRVLLPRHRG